MACWRRLHSSSDIRAATTDQNMGSDSTHDQAQKHTLKQLRVQRACRRRHVAHDMTHSATNDVDHRGQAPLEERHASQIKFQTCRATTSFFLGGPIFLFRGEPCERTQTSALHEPFPPSAKRSKHNNSMRFIKCYAKQMKRSNASLQAGLALPGGFKGQRYLACARWRSSPSRSAAHHSVRDRPTPAWRPPETPETPWGRRETL